MKKIFRSPITYIVVFLVALIVFLYNRGFRIVYDPNVINDWDAISAFASWFGAIASAGALLVAIHIPKVIAEQQNKIALFDKRYNTCDALLFLLTVVKNIVDGTMKEMEPKLFLDTIAGTYKSVSIVGEITSNCKELSDIYVRLIFEAGKIGYLFEIAELKDVLEFLKSTDRYISDVYKGNPGDITQLQAAYERLDAERIQEKLEQQLTLTT